MEIVFVLLMAFVGVSTVAGGSEQNIRKTYSRFQTVKRDTQKYPGKQEDFGPRMMAAFGEFYNRTSLRLILTCVT